MLAPTPPLTRPGGFKKRTWYECQKCTAALGDVPAEYKATPAYCCTTLELGQQQQQQQPADVGTSSLPVPPGAQPSLSAKRPGSPQQHPLYKRLVEKASALKAAQPGELCPTHQRIHGPSWVLPCTPVSHGAPPSFVQLCPSSPLPTLLKVCGQRGGGALLLALV